MSKVLFFYGTRPEAIKLYPLINESKGELKSKVLTVFTGQHSSGIKPIANLFKVKNDINIKLNRNNPKLEILTSSLLIKISKVLEKENPNLVVVHGDTTTTLVSSLAAFYKQIPIAHTEAGLRTNNIYRPFPEEINRSIVARMAKFNFCPTKEAYRNLELEGIGSSKLFLTGNTITDSVKFTMNQINTDTALNTRLKRDFSSIFRFKNFNLFTIHRRENWNNYDFYLENIKKFADINKNQAFVLCSHPNPELLSKATKFLRGYKNIFVLKPQSYIRFLFLMKCSSRIFTDSGGIQEEATIMGKKVFLIRESTERPEAIRSGFVELCNFDFISTKKLFNKMPEVLRPDKKLYGSSVSKKITKILIKHGY